MANATVAAVKATLKRIEREQSPSWILKGIDMLLSLAFEMKTKKEEKEEATRPLKSAYDKAKSPFDKELKEIDTMDSTVREEFLKRYTGVTALYPEEGDGEIAVKQSWRPTIVNEKEVPKKYWVVDVNALQTAIDDGIRTIPGVEIKKVRSLIVRTKRSPATE